MADNVNNYIFLKILAKYNKALFLKKGYLYMK